MFLVEENFREAIRYVLSELNNLKRAGNFDTELITVMFYVSHNANELEQVILIWSFERFRGKKIKCVL